jgi:predicted transcriptional regulator
MIPFEDNLDKTMNPCAVERYLEKISRGKAVITRSLLSLSNKRTVAKNKAP